VYEIFYLLAGPCYLFWLALALANSSSYWGKTSIDARLVCHSFFPYFLFFLSFFLYFLDPDPPLSPIFSIQIVRPHGRNMCRQLHTK
jgi:hypothetical protein